MGFGMRAPRISMRKGTPLKDIAEFLGLATRAPLESMRNTTPG
jgi:hypothetical protein